MKRAGLARRIGLKSRSTLTSRSTLKSTSSLKRAAPLAPGRPRRKVTIPRAAREAAKARSGGRCVACEARYEASPLKLRRPRRGHHLHHVLPERDFPELAREAANLVYVCVACHDEHERAHRRIPLEALPRETLALAARVGLTWYIDRFYPALDTRRGAS